MKRQEHWSAGRLRYFEMDIRNQELLEWLHKDPGTFISPKLVLRMSETSGNSVYCTEKIRRNEKLINIPPKYNMNFVTILQDLVKYKGMPLEQLGPYLELDYEGLEKLSSFQLISLYLAVESTRQDSFWSPFIRILPGLKDFELCPFTWLFEIDDPHVLLKFEMLPESVKLHSKKQFNQLTSDFHAVNEFLTTTDIPLDDFRRFWCCCNSRCLYMTLPDHLMKSHEDNFTMCPYVDFLNHDVNENCTVQINRKGFQVTCGVDYDAGSQIYFSYGPHPDDFLVCEYGFMFPRGYNHWNSLDLSPQILSLLDSRPFTKLFLEQNGYLGDYSVGRDVSFRIEVALLLLQEQEAEFQSLAPSIRRLNQFILGYSSGETYKKGINERLKQILEKVVEESEKYLALEEEDSKDNVIKRLYQNRYDIALEHLRSL